MNSLVASKSGFYLSVIEEKKKNNTTKESKRLRLNERLLTLHSTDGCFLYSTFIWVITFQYTFEHTHTSMYTCRLLQINSVVWGAPCFRLWPLLQLQVHFFLNFLNRLSIVLLEQWTFLLIGLDCQLDHGSCSVLCPVLAQYESGWDVTKPRRKQIVVVT